MQPSKLSNVDLVAATEYDAVCDLFRGLCAAEMVDEIALRDVLYSEDFDDAAIEWAIEILKGAGSRELFGEAP